MKSNLTCVSGYWKIRNKHGNSFDNWFHRTLKINCPYVFFADLDTIQLIKKYRGDLPTHYITCKITDFVTYRFKNKIKTDPVHCPSAELNLIWNEKIFMLGRAAEINPYKSDFFCWVDAGVCLYRNQHPPPSVFPNPDKLAKLPTDKFIYSSSEEYNPHLVNQHTYYHHVSGTYVLPRGIINDFAKLYQEYLVRLLDKNNIWTEQVVLTHIYKDHPHLFHKLGHGYAQVISWLA
jgi:hypothetical protein